MSNTLNPNTTEVLSSKEGESYIYDTVLFKDTGMKLRVRTPKTATYSDTPYLLNINDFVEESGIKLNGSDTSIKPIDAIIANPIIQMFSKNIVQDIEDNSYYTDSQTLMNMINRAMSAPTGSGIDWNVTRKDSLSIYGFLNASKGAILGGFLINNEKIQSLAETNFIPNIYLNGDNGSGHLAAGNVEWTSAGDLFIRGLFESNNNGDRVVISPYKRNIEFIGDDTGTTVAIGKNITFSNPNVPIDSVVINDSLYKTEILPGAVNVYRSSSGRTGYLRPTGIGFRYHNDNHEVVTAFEATMNDNRLLVQMQNLPRSKEGLPSGALWRDGENLKIV